MDNKKGGGAATHNNFVMGTDGKPILPPGDERTADPIKKMSVLATNMESISMNFK